MISAAAAARVNRQMFCTMQMVFQWHFNHVKSTKGILLFPVACAKSIHSYLQQDDNGPCNTEANVSDEAVFYFLNMSLVSVSVCQRKRREPSADVHLFTVSPSGFRRGGGAPWWSACRDWMFHLETFLCPMEWRTD